MQIMDILNIVVNKLHLFDLLWIVVDLMWSCCTTFRPVVDLSWICCGLVVDISTCCGFVMDFRFSWVRVLIKFDLTYNVDKIADINFVHSACETVQTTCLGLNGVVLQSL